MSPILIFRHIACEGPGYLGQYLDRRHLPYRVVKVDSGESIPPSIDRVGGLVFMGGPMSVNDSLPWIDACLELIRVAHDRRLPVLGHCLGSQLIAAALGGTVGANPVKEIGWLPVRRCTGVDHGVLPRQFDAFHWHSETFTLPAGAIHLFKSDACRHQGFQIGNTLALQFHIEIQKDMVGEWADLYANDLRDPGDTVQSRSELTRDLDARITAVNRIADAVYDHWLARSALY
ncbi:MAG: type 1 glutamine amidotransferase [Gammaproteobacteria bacterium]|nr:type 1 glutamine amidotransferase [Gammaproteobacteria bacterium]